MFWQCIYIQQKPFIDSTTTRPSMAATTSECRPGADTKSKWKCTKSTTTSHKIKAKEFNSIRFFYTHFVDYETKFVNIIRNYNCNWSLLTRSVVERDAHIARKINANIIMAIGQIMSLLCIFRYDRACLSLSLPALFSPVRSIRWKQWHECADYGAFHCPNAHLPSWNVVRHLLLDTSFDSHW